ncbi:hypothetical protein HMPREF1988_00581 [Porphyromonas gingivalis F0185]|nr:hypothetical protein HMPREF1988_00581 [Porphyromonas gingivalis F0185]
MCKTEKSQTVALQSFMWKSRRELFSALMAVCGRVGKWVPIGTPMNRQSPNDTDAAAGYRAGNLL